MHMPEFICEANRKHNNNKTKSNEWPLLLMKQHDVSLKLVPGNTKEYFAISHVWKPNKNSETKDMSPRPHGAKWKCEESPPGKMHSIASAIMRIEKIDTVALWIDSICINQSNEEQKGKEVFKMGEIYKNSRATYVLFAENKSANNAFLMHKMIKENGSKYCKWEKNLQIKFLEYLSIMCSDKWFTRCWTLQEVILSKNVYIINQKDDLVDLKRLLQYGGEIIGHLREEKYHDKIYIKYQREAERHNALQLYGYKEKGSAAYSMHLMKNRKCERLEDIVYSLRDILKYGSKINVNYEENYQNAMNRLVSIAAEHSDISFLFLPCKYLENPSYIPQLTDDFTNEIEHTVTENKEIKNIEITNEGLLVPGWVIGKVINPVKKKPWEEMDYIQYKHAKEEEVISSEVAKIKQCFNIKEKDHVFKYGIGVIESQWDTKKNKHNFNKEYTTLDDLRKGFGTKLWNFIVKVELKNGINSNLSSGNCLLCNQLVDTETGISVRQCHGSHEVLLDNKYCAVQAFSNSINPIKKNDVVIDIKARSWEGYPVFLIARDAGNCRYKRVGFFRQSTLVIGGSLYDSEPDKILFIKETSHSIQNNIVPIYRMPTTV